jgi:hypothetical protein
MWAPTRQVERLADGRFCVTVTPPAWSGFTHPGSIVLKPDQFDRYQNWLIDGSLIQDALPDLTTGQREILLSGIAPEDWDAEFSDDDT